MGDPIYLHGKDIAIGVPKTIPVGLSTKVYYAVYCNYKGTIELSNDAADTTAVYDTALNNVTAYQWYDVPGLYTIEVVSKGTCPSTGPDKAPLVLNARDITLKAEHSPTDIIADEELDIARAPTNLDTLFMTRWHKPTGVWITDLNISRSKLRNFTAAKPLTEPEESPTLISAEEALLQDDAPTEIQSNEILGVNAQPTIIDADAYLLDSNRPLTMSAAELLGASHAPTGLSRAVFDIAPPTNISAIEKLSLGPLGITSFNIDDIKPRNVTISDLFLSDTNNYPRNVSVSELNLNISHKPGLITAEEVLMWNHHRPSGLSGTRIIGPYFGLTEDFTNSLDKPTGLNTCIIADGGCLPEFGPSSLSAESTLAQDFSRAPRYIGAVNTKDLAPTNMAATDNLAFSVDQIPTQIAAEVYIPFFGYDEELNPINNEPWLFSLDDVKYKLRRNINTNRELHFRKPNSTTGEGEYGFDCNRLNWSDTFIGEDKGLIHSVIKKEGNVAIGDHDCDGDGYFDATSTSQSYIVAWVYQTVDMGPFSDTFLGIYFRGNESEIASAKSEIANGTFSLRKEDHLIRLFLSYFRELNEFDLISPDGKTQTAYNGTHIYSRGSGDPCEGSPGQSYNAFNVPWKSTTASCGEVCITPWGEEVGLDVVYSNRQLWKSYKQADIWEDYEIEYIGPDYLHHMHRENWEKMQLANSQPV